MSPAGQLLLPALVLLPLLALLPGAWHGGGFDLIGQFLLAAVQLFPWRDRRCSLR